MLNVVILTGRFTHDLELKTLENGNQVLKFSLAVARSRVAPDKERETDFIDCTAWNKTAEFINKYFKKGSLITVEGNLQTRSYEDKQGNKRKAYEVLIREVHFCESKKDKQEPQEPAHQIEQTEILDDTDLPF